MWKRVHNYKASLFCETNVTNLRFRVWRSRASSTPWRLVCCSRGSERHSAVFSRPLFYHPSDLSLPCKLQRKLALSIRICREKEKERSFSNLFLHFFHLSSLWKTLVALHVIRSFDNIFTFFFFKFALENVGI